MGKIFVFMGKSSSGKDTIFKTISNDLDNILTTTLYTTRPIRDEEINGIDYYFVSDETHEQMKQDNLVIESRSYNTVHGIWTYFTAATNIDLIHNNYMIINTLEGYEKFKEYYGEDKVIPIYIEVEDGIRLERALIRERKQSTPKYEELCSRFLADQKDFSEENLLKSKISAENRFINDDLIECILAIEKKIIEALEKSQKSKTIQQSTI